MARRADDGPPTPPTPGIHPFDWHDPQTTGAVPPDDESMMPSPSWSPPTDLGTFHGPGPVKSPAQPAQPKDEPKPAAVAPRPAPAMTPAPARVPRTPPPDEFRTIGIGAGFEIGPPERGFVLQYSDGKRHWRDLERVGPERRVVGRSSFREVGPVADFLADDHFRVIAEDDRLIVEPGASVNGVYLKLEKGRPFAIASGARFQVAQHVVEFQGAGPSTADRPGLWLDGEGFRSMRLVPLAYLDFLGPDGEPAVRFPLTKPKGTIIGREGDFDLPDEAGVVRRAHADIILPETSGASRGHARVSARGGRFYLEDLGSTNGTFTLIDRPTPIRPWNLQGNVAGDVLLVGAVFVRAIEA